MINWAKAEGSQTSKHKNQVSVFLMKLVLFSLILASDGLNIELPKFDIPFGNAPKTPSVSPPADFLAPARKPLSANPSQLPSLLSGGAGLALRLGSGAFVLGWKSDVLSGDSIDSVPSATPFGQVAFSDSSTVLASAEERGIRQPLVLYEVRGKFRE